MKIVCICSYWEKPGWSYSSNSKQLVFSVIEVPPSPLLRVDPLPQTVKDGDSLLLLCSAEGGNTEKKFHFYKDAVEMVPSFEWLLESSRAPSDPLQNASLRILHAKPNHSGEFACSYEEKRSSRWIMSSWSQAVNVTVSTHHADTMWRYTCLAIPFIILLAAFAFYCWRKKSSK
ncbi:uncharacterized protein PHA67_016763 [Liasis olivaceus]